MAFRVLLAQFMHETNTFSKLPTTLDDYRRRFLVEGEAIVPKFKGTKNEMGGYIDSAAKYGWQPVYAVAANATPSGTLTRETWETIRDIILNTARKAGKLDGICLSLHGAMVTETEDDAEGALLEALGLQQPALLIEQIKALAQLTAHLAEKLEMRGGGVLAQQGRIPAHAFHRLNGTSLWARPSAARP